MKTIYTIFSGKELMFAIQLTPKKKQYAKPNEDQYEPMMKTYMSKVGTQSLIFQPTLGLRITSKQNTNLSAIVPGHLIYQLAGIFQYVLNTEQKYRSNIVIEDPDSGQLMLTSQASQYAKQISLFRSMLAIAPALVESSNEVTTLGLALYMDLNYLGAMSAEESEAFIDTINHFDLSTYSLLAGLSTKIMDIDEKLDKIMLKLGIR